MPRARVVCVCGAVPRASRSCFAASGLRGQWMPSTWVLEGSQSAALAEAGVSALASH